MKDQSLLLEPKIESLFIEDDEWKLFVSQDALNEIELKYGSDPKLITAKLSCEIQLKQQADFKFMHQNESDCHVKNQ